MLRSLREIYDDVWTGKMSYEEFVAELAQTEDLYDVMEEIEIND
jgi:hypothetical protein